MEPFNYFNYFTEIEEYFWRKRGAHLLVSPLDWAIVETWQRAGIPLDAVLRGIDSAFESYERSRRGGGKAAEEPGLLRGCGARRRDGETGEFGGQPVPSRSGQRRRRSHFRARSCALSCLRNIEKLEQAAGRLRSSDADLARRIAQAQCEPGGTAAGCSIRRASSISKIWNGA